MSRKKTIHPNTLNNLKNRYEKGNNAAQKPFDWELFDKLLARRMNLYDCAELLKVGVDLIQNRVIETHGIEFNEYRLRKLASTKLPLIEKALKLALEEDNVVMLKFCLKNLCGWSDKMDFINYDIDGNLKDDAPKIQQFTLNYSLDSGSKRNVIETTSTEIITEEI